MRGTGLSLAEDLLEEAVKALVSQTPGQAGLRRAVSTAYYALFHLLVADVASKVVPVTPAGLGLRVARSPAHTEMRDVCTMLAKSSMPKALALLQPAGFSVKLLAVAEAFVDLQKARHGADDDLALDFTLADVEGEVQLAISAFENWKSVRDSDEATVLLAALLFAKRWSR